jgi:hypothetical protein
VFAIRGKSFTAARGRDRRRRPALEALECRNLPSFLPPVAYPLGPGPAALAAGDFTGDGVPDLVSVAANTVRLSPGNGDGTFQSFLLNNGDGTFTGTVTLPVTHPVVGDFTGHGNLDVAGVSGTNSVSVFPGNGDGTFGPPVVSHVGGLGVFTLAAADFDGDGHLDLAATTSTSSDHEHTTRLRLLLGQGDGTFQEAPVSTPILQYGAVPVFMAAADFSGDGTPELIVGDHLLGDVVILRGAGDGSFRPVDSFGVFGVNGLDSGVVGDFNGDGLPDFAVTDGTAQVFLNAGDGGNGPGATSPASHGSRALGDPSSAVAAAELLVADVRPQPVSPAVGRPASAFAVAAPSAAGLAEPFALPPAQPLARAPLGPTHRPADRAEAVDVAGPADPLAGSPEGTA